MYEHNNKRLCCAWGLLFLVSSISFPTAAAERRGTDKTPLVVKVLPSPKSAEETGAEEEERKEKAANEAALAEYTRQLAEFTHALVVVGVVQGCVLFLQLVTFAWQGRQLKRTVDSAQQTERPYLFLKPAGTHVSVAELAALFLANNQELPPRVDYAVINHGRTPAIVKSIKVRLCVGVELPAQPRYDLCDSANRGGDLILEVSKASPPLYAEMPWADFPGAVFQAVQDGNQHFFFYGLITYEDIYGIKHETGFGLRVWRDGQHHTDFVEAGGKPYNYYT